MSRQLFSSSWYRVARLKPRLRGHARIHRHRYRGKTWFVLQDLSTGKFHRFTPAAYRVIGLLDGRSTVDEIWNSACEELGEEAPTQDELITVLVQLHSADALQSDIPPDTAELFERYEKQRNATLRGRLMSPFAIQIPLFDPEKMLSRTIDWIRPFFSSWGLALWLLLVVPAVILAGVHFRELTEGIIDRIATPGNVILIWLLFPMIKALHELGHAYAAKAFGAEVHDLGVMFLVLTPIPYVDASGASAFRRRAHRVIVGSAGMLVEGVLAALAMYVWVNAEPGIVRTLAFNTMLIGGVTTLAFNANPLLRFDGYYIMADMLEIPNLRQRANNYFGYILERYVAGSKDASPPEGSDGERAWLFSYAVASAMYRVVVIFAIGFFVLQWSFTVGMILLAVSSVGWLIMPAGKGLKFLFASPRLRRVRYRAVGAAAATLGGLILLIFLIPMPLRTLAEGVVWLSDEAMVRTETAGFVERVAAVDGSMVEQGDLLFELSQPTLLAEEARLRARIRELEAGYEQQLSENFVEAQVLREELEFNRQTLTDVLGRKAGLSVRAGRSGVFVAPRLDDLPGRYLSKGETVGEVVDLNVLTVRAVVPQDDIELVRTRLEAVHVRLAENLGEEVEATVHRVVPAASERLPSAALGMEGGGAIITDPRGEGGRIAMAPVFELELAVPAASGVVNAGGRVHVRFHLGYEPLVSQWYRRMRQLFLASFHV